jgi:hypothetical protein
VNWGQFGGFRPLTPFSCYNDNAQFGTQTVDVPVRFSLPVKVSITGHADDDLAVDGKSVTLSTCRIDGPISTTFCLNKSSFELAAIDNFGWISSYNVKVCFSSGASCNPLP